MNHIVKLGTVATYVNGYAFKPSDWSDVGVPIIRIQDLTGNSYQMNRFSGEYDKKYEVQNGDVLIAWSASLGVYVWKSEKAVLNQHIFKVYFDKVDVDKDFFVYQMERLLQKASSQAHGATMRHLTKVVFDNLPFYLPDKETQIEIAKRLSTVTALIDLRKKELVKLDELVKSRFIEMFGDPNSKLGKYSQQALESICSKINDGEHGSVPRIEKGIIFLNAKNIKKNGTIDWEQVTYIDEVIHNRIYKRCNPEPGDILLTTTGTIGNACIVPCVEQFSMDRGITLVKPNHKIVDSIFLITLLRSQYLQICMNQNIHASAIGHLFLNKVKKLPVFVPPIDLQNEFADFVKSIDKSKLAIQKSLDDLETLKKSLMQKYFG